MSSVFSILSFAFGSVVYSFRILGFYVGWLPASRLLGLKPGPGLK